MSQPDPTLTEAEVAAEPPAPEQSAIDERPWYEFQAAGLFWFVNRILHLFGWVLVYTVDGQGKIDRVYPARTTFRGFEPKVEDAGFFMLSSYLKDNIDSILAPTVPKASFIIPK